MEGEDKPGPDIQCLFVNPIKCTFAFLSALYRTRYEYRKVHVTHLLKLTNRRYDQVSVITYLAMSQ